MTAVAPMSHGQQPQQQQHPQVPADPPVVYEPGHAGAGRVGGEPGGGDVGGRDGGDVGPSQQAHPYVGAFAANDAANKAKQQKIAQDVAKQNTGLAYGLRRGFGANTAPPGQTPTAPQALNVKITGTPRTGSNLTGTYQFFDPNLDSESGSTYQWKRAGVDIAGQTGRQHACIGADENQVLTFTVTPRSATAPQAGAPVTSPGVTVLAAGAAVQESREPEQEQQPPQQQQPDFGFGA